MMIGMHAAAGTTGFLAHTLTSRLSSLTVNGRPMAEVELFSASLAPFGIPPLFFSGCPRPAVRPGNGSRASEPFPSIKAFLRKPLMPVNGDAIWHGQRPNR
jgi:hypothetical protein